MEFILNNSSILIKACIQVGLTPGFNTDKLLDSGHFISQIIQFSHTQYEDYDNDVVDELFKLFQNCCEN